MKICLLSASVTGLGGAEAVVRLLADNLVRRGHEVLLLTLDQRPANTDTSQHAFEVQYLNSRVSDKYALRESRGALYKAWWQLRSLLNPQLMKALEASIADFQPDIIHTHKVRGFPRQLWPRLSAVAACPVIHTCHDIELLSPVHTISMVEAGALTRMFLSVFQWIARSPGKSVSSVTSPSEFMLELHHMHKLFPGADRLVIPNFHDLDPSTTFLQLQNPPQDESLKVLFIGRLVKVKGILSLCEAVAKSSNAGMNIELRIAGDGELREQVEDYSNNHDCIEFLGPVIGRDKAQLFNWCHVVAAPSEYDETFCIVAAEAISAFRPVLASGRGGLPEVVTDGETGWVYKGEGVDAVLSGLRLVEQSRHEFEAFSARCAQLAIHFSPDAIIDRYEGNYQSTIALANGISSN